VNKLLVVGDSPVLVATLIKVLSMFVDVEIETVSTRNALNKFQEWEPTHILFADYDEQTGGSRGAYIEMKAYLEPGQKMVRMGWRQYNHPDYMDYIRQPQGLVGIIEFLGLPIQKKEQP
jgi:hypothetical protein